MARIPMVPQESTDPTLRPVFEKFLEQRGAVPNMFRILAHVPKTLDAFGRCFQAIMAAGAVDVPTKELVALAVSRENRSEYCASSHTMIARRLGVPEEKIAAAAAPASPALSPAERAAVVFAIESTRRPEGVPEAVFAELKRHWSDVQVVEIASVVGIFNFTNRFANSLAVECTVYPER